MPLVAFHSRFIAHDFGVAAILFFLLIHQKFKVMLEVRICWKYFCSTVLNYAGAGCDWKSSLCFGFFSLKSSPYKKSLYFVRMIAVVWSLRGRMCLF